MCELNFQFIIFRFFVFIVASIRTKFDIAFIYKYNHYHWFLLTLWLVRYLPVSMENDLVLTPPSDSSLPRHIMSAQLNILCGTQNSTFFISPMNDPNRPNETITSHSRAFTRNTNKCLDGNADNSLNNYDHFKAITSEKGFFPLL